MKAGVARLMIAYHVATGEFLAAWIEFKKRRAEWWSAWGKE